MSICSNFNVATVILCGGKSKRFNFKDKALLDYTASKSFLEKIILECRGDVYLSLDNKDKYNTLLSNYKNIKIIEDIYNDIGPIGGIYSSFINIDSDYIQFLSCDSPSINSDFLYYMNSMVDEYHDAFIAVYNDKPYFLCSIYSKRILSRVKENILKNEYSIKKLLDGIKVKYIDLKYTIFKLFNVNTLDDYLYFKKSMPQYFSICGKKNSGKTTLICKIIKEFTNIGKTVAVIKHTSHEHSFDVEGKDTYNYKVNGAKATLIYSKSKYMLVKDYEINNDESDLINFINSMSEYDIIILEGFKHISSIPKIEVFRKEISDIPLCMDNSLKALVTDNMNYETNLPIFHLDDITSIFNFIISNLIF